MTIKGFTSPVTGPAVDANIVRGNDNVLAAAVNVLEGRVSSSGVLTGGVLSVGTGGPGVATTFSVTAGTGQIVDNTVDPSTVTAVSWTVKTDVAVTNLLTQLVTFVALDSAGAVVQSGTDFTPSQQREYVVLGVVVHSNQTTVNAVNQTQIVAYAPGGQLNDLLYGLGLFNVSGNVFSANGANMKLNKSAGSIFRRGSNYTTLSDNPHIKTTASLTQAPLRMQNVTGAGSASTTDVDVANYDVAGVTTAVSPATRFTVLRIFLFQSNLIAVQRGQALYNSLAEAKAAIQTEPYVTNAILAANGLLRGFICVQANATSLNDASKVFFIEPGKFGGTSGVGGLSVSTLQNAYDNSSSPEILTDATRLGLTVRRGSGADTDLIYEGQNNAGSTTFSVTGAGVGAFGSSLAITGALTGVTDLTASGLVTAGKLVPTANTVAGNGMYLPAANVVAFSTNGAERMRIDASGNLLLSGASATALAVASGSATGQVIQGVLPVLMVVDDGDTTNFKTYIANNGGTGYVWNVGNHPLLLGTNDTERARITASGNVGIGTTTPGYLLDVNGVTNTLTEYRVAGTKVVGAQGAAVADATDAASVITQLNALLARVRTHGLIAT